MIYGRYVAPDIAAKIADETAAFHLPPDWREGRERVEGFTVDEGKSRTADDAVYAEVRPDGGYTLTVSVADAASFLAQPSELRKLARVRELTQHNSRGRYPLWPDEIVRSYLSLRDGVERPVVVAHIPISARGESDEAQIGRGILRAQKCNKEHFSSLLQPPSQGEAPAEPHPLLAVAHALRSRRLPASRSKKLFASHVQLGDRVLAELIHVYNRSMGDFALRHAIPVPFRTTTNAAHELAVFSTAPDNEDEPYVRASSPLWRFADFVCQANVLAHVEGQSLPFSEDQVEAMVGHYNMRKRTKNIPSPAKAQAIHDAIQVGTAGVREIMTAFAVPDTMVHSLEIRTDALSYALGSPQLTSATLAALISRRALTIRNRTADDAIASSRVLEDSTGNVFPYWPDAYSSATSYEATVKQVGRQWDNAHTLAQISRISKEPPLPWHLQEGAAKILWAPTYLKEIGVAARYQYTKDADGLIRAKVVVRHNGQAYESEALERDEKLARSKAAYTILEQILPQPAGLELEKLQVQQLRALDTVSGHGSRQYLMQYIQARLRGSDVEAPKFEYTFTEPDPDSNEPLACTLAFTYEGIDHAVTVTGTMNRKLLKEIAALRMLKRFDAPILARIPNYHA